MSQLGVPPPPPPTLSMSEARPVAHDATNENEQTFKRVLGDLWEHSETLVRQEVELVKAEAEARLIHAKAALIRGAISAGLAHAAYLTTLATIVLVLAQWMDAWLASFIVAVLAITGAAVFAYLGKKEAEETVEKPHQTPQSGQLRHRAHT